MTPLITFSNPRIVAETRPAARGSAAPAKAIGVVRKILLAAALVVPAVFAAGGASAQTNDFTLNIDNTHFSPVPAGGLADYVVRIDNAGNFGTSATEITFSIPADTDYEGVTGLDNCDPASGTGPLEVTCAVPAIAVDGNVEARVNLRHNVEGTVGFAAEIAGGPTFSRSTTVQRGADLALTLTADPQTVRAGDHAQFVARVTNEGPYPSGPATVEVTIPTGMSRDIAMPAGCSIAGALISCEVGGLADGQSVEFPFSSQVTAADLSDVTMSALVRSTDPRDPNTGNDQDTADLTIEPGTDVSIGKARSPLGLLLVGDEVAFTLTPGLAGQAPASAQITDTLPDNYAVTDVTAGPGWSCAVTGQAVTCDYAEGPGTDYKAPIVVTANAVAAGQGVVNTANIASPEENGGAGGNNAGSDTGADITEPTIDLRASKSGPPRGLVTVHNAYDFALSARNEGNLPFDRELTYIDHIPSGLTVTAISAPAGWTCPALPVGGIAGAQDIACTTDKYVGAPLAPGDWADTITITAEVTATGQISNGMTAEYPGYLDDDNTPGNNTTTDGGLTSEDNGGWADVSVRKTVSSSPVLSGDPITFRIEVVNTGPATAQDVRMSDRLEPIVNFEGGYPTNDPTINANGMVCSFGASGQHYYRDLTCNIDSLPVCEPGTDCPYVDVTVNAGGIGSQSNTAVAYSYETPDPVTSDNEVTVPFQVTPRTDVFLDKTSASMNAGAAVGQPITYVLTAGVVQNGLSPAENVVVRDTLPDGVRFISATASGGSTCSVAPPANAVTDGSNNLVQCEFGTINNGSQRTVTVVVVPTLPLLTEPVIPIVNNATVSTTTPETDADNNEASVSIPINPPSLDLIVSKVEYLVPGGSGTPDPVLIGTDAGYRITVTNAGPSDATNVEITDILPLSGFVNPSLPATSGGWTCELVGVTAGNPGGQMICRNPYVPAGSSAVFEFTMEASARGLHTNAVTASSAETDANPAYDINPGNNADTENTRVRVRSDVAVTKTAVEAGDPDAPLSVVDLREEFAWKIEVTSLSGPGLDISEAVTLADTLPDGMVLSNRATPVTTTQGSCQGVAGSRQISCDLGDIDVDEVVAVMAWVRVINAAQGASIANTATVDTLSFDQNPANNSATGTVTTVRASTIEGSIWRDFNDDATQQVHDTGLGGVTVNLAGVAQHDGAAITASATTAADGSYSFPDLPPGIYEVSYVGPGGRMEPGRAISGGDGGTEEQPDAIAGITVVQDQISSGHDFTLIPQAQLSVTKSASAAVFNADGSYSITYTIAVTNHSEEPLENITVIDNLTGRNFGGYTPDAVPGPNEYTVSAASVGGFTGQDGADALWTSGTLGVGQGHSLVYTLRVNPGVPRPQPLSHTNEVNAAGEGEWSGQISTGPDANADLADSDTAVVTPAFNPGIAITKTASFTGSTPPAEGDRIDYTFRIANTGNTPLVDVTLADDLDGLEDLDTTPIALLAPGAFVERTAHYLLTQDDLDNGRVDNTASTSGQWGDGGGMPLRVSDDDDATVTALADPGLSIEKSISSTTVTDPTELGQTITYHFVVENTGNTNLRDVVVVDPLLGAVPELAVGALAPGESRTVTAAYTVDQDDIDLGRVDNTAFARGVSGPSDTPVESDEDEAEQELYQQPGLVLVKVIDPASVPADPRAGDRISWTVTATNTGNVTLDNVSVSDPIAGAAVTPPAVTTIAPGASIVFTVTAPLTQDHINEGAVVNQATAGFDTPDGNPGTPVQSSNDPGDPDTPQETTTPLNQRPEIGLVKEMITSIPGTVGVGTELRYRFTIRNQGNLPLSALDLDDDLPGFVLDPASQALLDTAILQPQNADSSIPFEDTQIVVEGVYRLTQDDIEEGSVTNQAEIVAVPTHGPSDPVTDESGTDFDNDEPTITSLDQEPQVRLVKTISETSFDGRLPMEGDTITYGFAVHNTGNVILNSIAIEELLIGADVRNSGWTGPLAPTEIEADAITATYVLTQADIDRGFIENSAEVSGIGAGPTGPERVTDISGTTTGDDDPNRLDFDTLSGIAIVKSYEAGLSAPPQPGDTITYTFLVTNTGNLTLTDVVVSDPLPDLDMPVIVIDTLLPGDDNAVELTATYALKQSDIQAGEVINQADVEGSYTDPDTGQPEDESSTSNQVRVPLDQVPGIAVIKSASASLADPTLVGEEIEYTFTVRNTGNLELTDVVIDDPLIVPAPPEFTIGDLAPGAQVTVGPIVYSIVQDDIDRGEVVNQATATGTYDDGSGPAPTSDLSGPSFEEDEPIIIEVFQPRPSLTIEKTAAFMGGSSYALVDDPIDFTFVIENTGNVEITDVSPRELAFTFDGTPAEGQLSDFDPLSADLMPGESATFTARYLLTQGDLNAGAGVTDGVSNTAEATGTFEGTEIVSPDDTAVLTLLPQPPSDVTITKITTRPNIRRGETVPFEITVTNNSLADAGLVTITDRIPAGFVFVEGSASVNGAAFTPVVDGRDVVFANLRLPPSGELVIGLVLRALPATTPGRYTNIAFGADALGTPLADEARASVEILAEAVFDCTDIIGTVFNDLNGNGYQDQGEPGIPGVRLSTARGILVTTDAFGRFSIPCAALPAANIGSNFVLKIDEQTLPTGFALTTDNPAMVRLTPGKMVEINFGVSLGREIRLTVGDVAFTGNGTAPTGEMMAGIDQLIALLAEERSRLILVLETSRGDLAAGRVDTIEALIEERWRRQGAPYRLDIETTVIER